MHQAKRSPQPPPLPAPHTCWEFRACPASPRVVLLPCLLRAGPLAWRWPGWCAWCMGRGAGKAASKPRPVSADPFPEEAQQIQVKTALALGAKRPGFGAGAPTAPAGMRRQPSQLGPSAPLSCGECALPPNRTRCPPACMGSAAPPGGQGLSQPGQESPCALTDKETEVTEVRQPDQGHIFRKWWNFSNYEVGEMLIICRRIFTKASEQGFR